jgi:hypothetical protein
MEVNNSLSKRRDVLKLAVASVLESIRQDPNKYNYLINSNQHHGAVASDPHIDAYRTMILHEAQMLFDLIVRNLTSGIVNEPTLTIHWSASASSGSFGG